MTATCRVTFGSGSGGDPHYVIELDDSRNLDADGQPKTSFQAGDTIWFLLHVQPGYRPERVYETDGQATLVGLVSRIRTEEGLFFSPEGAVVELQYYPSGAVSVEWQGNSLGLQPVAGRTLAASAQPDRIARADVSYPVAFWSLRFDPPDLSLGPEDDYQIDVQIPLEAIP
jgi:hypothetical protein